MNIAQASSSKALERPLRLTHKSLSYLRRNYHYLTEDPQFFWMMMMARFEFARELATRSGASSRASLQTFDSHLVSAPASLREAHATLRQEGYFVGLQLAPSVVEELRERCRNAVCYGDRRRDLPFLAHEREELEQRIGRPLKVASYFDQQEDWPVFRALRSDPWLLALARAYLGCEPVYLRSELSWSFPGAVSRTDKIANAQVFHCDINDFKTLKVFFYLTDVDEDAGPHEYIKKDPRARTLLHQLMGQRVASLHEDALVQTYGKSSVVRICGPAGLGFVSDPYYFHRGETPKRTSRLLFQIELGCRRYKTWYANL